MEFVKPRKYYLMMVWVVMLLFMQQMILDVYKIFNEYFNQMVQMIRLGYMP